MSIRLFPFLRRHFSTTAPKVILPLPNDVTKYSEENHGKLYCLNTLSQLLHAERIQLNSMEVSPVYFGTQIGEWRQFRNIRHRLLNAISSLETSSIQLYHCRPLGADCHRLRIAISDEQVEAALQTEQISNNLPKEYIDRVRERIELSATAWSEAKSISHPNLSSLITDILPIHDRLDDKLWEWEWGRLKILDLIRNEEIKLLVSLDIEAFERSTKLLTEFGISLVECANGQFKDEIETRHIVVKENRHMINKKFVKNNKENFNYGKSEYLRTWEALEYLHSFIGSEKCLLVGHAIDCDERLVRECNNGGKIKRLLDYEWSKMAVDVQKWHQYAMGLSQGRKLKTVATDLKINFNDRYLHNAGNDSHLTMQCFKHLLQPAPRFFSHHYY